MIDSSKLKILREKALANPLNENQVSDFTPELLDIISFELDQYLTNLDIATSIVDVTEIEFEIRCDLNYLPYRFTYSGQGFVENKSNNIIKCILNPIMLKHPRWKLESVNIIHPIVSAECYWIKIDKDSCSHLEFRYSFKIAQKKDSK